MTQGTEGRWNAMATLSPLKRRWAFVAKFLWPLMKRLNRARLLLPTGANKLSQIGFARWSLVWKVPPKEGTRIFEGVNIPKPYILFETNFNGDSDQYFESFSYVSESSISRTWRGTYGMPKVKRVGAFIWFINDNKKNPAAFYTGYPEASAKMVRSALELKWHHDKLNPRVPEMSDADFLSRYKKLLRDAQKQNPPLRSPYAPTSGGGGMTTRVFTAITPYDTLRKGSLKTDLDALPDDWAPSTTHFARLIPIEEVMWRTLPKGFKNMEPIRPCLVFGASFDDERDDYLEKLHAREHIWRNCDGWDGGAAESFAQYLCDHEYDFDLPYTPYDGVPKDEIKSALQLSERFWEFAVEKQGLTTPAGAGELRQAWIAEFPS
jgi:hypothetical protein